MKLAERLLFLRNEHHFTQQIAAEKIGIAAEPLRKKSRKAECLFGIFLFHRKLRSYGIKKYLSMFCMNGRAYQGP